MTCRNTKVRAPLWPQNVKLVLREPKCSAEGDEASRDDDKVIRRGERGEFISLDEFPCWWRDRRGLVVGSAVTVVGIVFFTLAHRLG